MANFGINPLLAAVLAAQGHPVPGSVAPPPGPAPGYVDPLAPLAPPPGGDPAPGSSPISQDLLNAPPIEPNPTSINDGINSVGRPSDLSGIDAAAHDAAVKKMHREGVGDSLMALGAGLLSGKNFSEGLGAGIKNYMASVQAAREKAKPTHESIDGGAFDKVTDPADDSVTFNRTPDADFKETHDNVISTTKFGTAQIGADARTGAAQITADASLQRGSASDQTKLAMERENNIAKVKVASMAGVLPDQNVINYFADAVHHGMPISSLGAGMGKQATAFRMAVLSQVANDGAGDGETGSDFAAQQANFKGGVANVVNLHKQLGTVQASEQTALANGDQFLQASRKVIAQSKYPVLNSATQSYLRHTGDPNIAAMDLAANTFANEYAKVIAGTPNGGGVLSDSAREEAMSVLRGNYSIDQKISAYNQAKKDMANRIGALHSSIASGLTNVTTPGRPNSGTPHSRAVPGPQPGQVVRGYRFNGGNPADQHNWTKI
jgi:hypothetical protein